MLLLKFFNPFIIMYNAMNRLTHIELNRYVTKYKMYDARHELKEF